VALGAAIQASVLSGETHEVLLLDVTPLSLAVETVDGQVKRLIERNTTIPTRRSEIFTTAHDDQSSVEVHIVQGERSLARENQSLGRLHLEGIRPAPQGIPEVEVIFDIDANGIVTISVRDHSTGQRQQARLAVSTTLPRAKVEQLAHEAQSYAKEDKRRREWDSARHRAEALAYEIKRSREKYSSHLPAALCNEAEQALAQLREALAGGSLFKVRAAISVLRAIALRMDAAISASISSSKSRPLAAQDEAADQDTPQDEGPALDAAFREG
jgi:molecular chaperone DnaK